MIWSCLIEVFTCSTETKDPLYVWSGSGCSLSLIEAFFSFLLSFLILKFLVVVFIWVGRNKVPSVCVAKGGFFFLSSFFLSFFLLSLYVFLSFFLSFYFTSFLPSLLQFSNITLFFFCLPSFLLSFSLIELSKTNVFFVLWPEVSENSFLPSSLLHLLVLFFLSFSFFLFFLLLNFLFPFITPPVL